MHLAVLKYSVLRLALFVGSIAVLAVVGVKRSIMLFVLAALISLALSYLLLGKQREAVATGLSGFVEGRVSRRAGIGDADADEEDAAIAQAELAQAELTQAGVIEAPPMAPVPPTSDEAQNEPSSESQNDRPTASSTA